MVSSSSEGLKPTIALRTSNVPALVMKAHKKIDKALKELRTNWRELNYLKNATFWNPKPWDDDWEFMEHLIALVQKVRGIK